jgi:hypothetical protein
VRALQDGASSVWSDLLVGLQTGQVTLAHGRVVLGPGGKPRAFLFAAFYPDRALERLPFSLPSDARVTLLDRQGGLLYTTQNPAPTQRDFSRVPEVRQALAGETVRFPAHVGQSGEARYGVIVPVPRTGWVLSFTRPVGPLEASLRAAFLEGLSTDYRAAVEGHSPWPRDVHDPRPVLVADATVDASLGDDVREVVVAEGIRSLAFVPLVHAYRLIGKFMIYYDQPHTFTEEEIQLVETIGTRVASGVARQRASDALVSAYAAEQTARSEAEGARSRLSFLAEASSVLASSMDYQITLKNLARLAVPRIADWCAVYTFQEDGSTERLELAHTDPVAEERIKGMVSQRAPDPRAVQTPMGQGLRMGRTVLVEDVTDEWIQQATKDEDMRMLLREVDPVPSSWSRSQHAVARSAASCLPRRDAGRLVQRTSRSRRSSRAAASVAVDNARLFEREHVVARPKSRVCWVYRSSLLCR